MPSRLLAKAGLRCLTVVATGVVGVVDVGAASASVPPLYKNCAALNARFPHGLGRVGAHDHTSGAPVTNFTRNNRLYAVAMFSNNGLDRDRDGIACEKK